MHVFSGRRQPGKQAQKCNGAAFMQDVHLRSREAQIGGQGATWACGAESAVRRIGAQASFLASQAHLPPPSKTRAPKPAASTTLPKLARQGNTEFTLTVRQLLGELCLVSFACPKTRVLLVAASTGTAGNRCSIDV